MNNQFITEFEGNINFFYNCFDRVILKGYVRWLFTASALAYFLKLLGFNKASQGVMRILTDQLNKHIEKEAKKYGVEIIPWERVKSEYKGKSEYVQKNFADKYNGIGNFVLCIITAQENVLTFGARELVSQKNEKYHKIYKCKKIAKNYYIYFYDEKLGGPCYLKICSYLPFDCEFYFNGHNAIKLELSKRGISYKMKDNAFTQIQEPKVIEEINRTLDGPSVLKRVQYWMDRFFKFDKGLYSTRSKYLNHEWYCSQIEVCSNVLFQSPRFCTSLFERLLDRFSRFGLPERISQIFDTRPRRLDSKGTWKKFNNSVCIRHWFRKNSVKMYNKTGSFIRVETTINNPKSLGHKLNKSAIYLQAYLWFGIGCNDRFYNCCADIDVASIPDIETDKFSKPITSTNGKKIAAPDLRKDRQIELFKQLINPKYSAFHFKIADLLLDLSGYFRNSAEIRYEITKLKARGVISKKQGHSLYGVTKEGFKWLWIQICSHDHFQNPMISRTLKKEAKKNSTQPSKIEQAYSLLDQGLSLFSQAVGIAS